MRFGFKKICWLVLVLCLAACQAGGGAQQPATEPNLEMVFMPGYKPQANLPFVGAYVAQEKGFFAAQHLTVTIQHSSGKGEHLQMVATGKVQVTTQDAAVLLQRQAEPGLPLVSIALLGQRGQQAYAALASAGLSSPKDWEGKTVGFKGTPSPELYALLQAAGADLKKIKMVNVGFDPRLLTEGKVDVYPVFRSNEPYQMRQWGYPVTVWDARDFGVPTLGLTYVSSDETVKNQPETLARFLRGALQGIDYAANHLDEAVEIVMKYAGPETDRGNMRFMLEGELADYLSPVTQANGPGWQTLEQWQDLAQMLKQSQALPATANPAEVFTNQILERCR